MTAIGSTLTLCGERHTTVHEVGIMGEKGNVAASATTIPVTQANRGLGGQLSPTTGFSGGSAAPQPNVGLGKHAAQAASAGGSNELIDLADSAGDFALGVVSEAAVERYVDRREEHGHEHGHEHGGVEQPEEPSSGEQHYF
jgi:hypothetical protein